MNAAPSFVEQQRFSDALRALFRRTVFHATGAYPDDIQLGALMRTEFALATREFGPGFWAKVTPLPPTNTQTSEPGVPETSSVGSDQLKEAEQAIWYAKTNGITSIPDALRWFKEHHGIVAAAPTVTQCVFEFMLAKRQEGRARTTLNGYGAKLRRFAVDFGGRQPMAVKPQEIAKFLVQWQHTTTRKDWWQTLSTFFAWCVRRKYVLENPLPLALARPRSRRGPGLVLTPDEAKFILRRTRSTDEIGFWALAMFAGLRTEEIRRLQAHPARWSLIRLRSGVIDLPHEVAKAFARTVPILPVLRPWLKWVKDRDLPFFPVNHYAKCRGIRRSALAARCEPMLAQIKAKDPDVSEPAWTYNVARRSYIAYRLAEASASYVDVANEVGNSETIIRLHYYRKVTLEAAREYFSFTPEAIARD